MTVSLGVPAATPSGRSHVRTSPDTALATCISPRRVRVSGSMHDAWGCEGCTTVWEGSERVRGDQGQFGAVAASVHSIGAPSAAATATTAAAATIAM